MKLSKFVSMPLMSSAAAAKYPAPPPIDAAPGQSGRVRLGFLDGLRGLSAFYVMLFHMGTPPGLPFGLVLAWEWTHFGRSAVGIFIVLSGYSLMLPVARSADGRLRGGFWDYIKRRTLRILPPYYAAMAIIIALLLTAKHLGSAIGDLSHNVHADDLTVRNVVSHIFLLQNWVDYGRWNGSIESSMWSVSVEWQIYFLFPLLLLPLWRRFGLVVPIVVGLLIGIVPLMTLSKEHNFVWASPWYVGLFAMGMAGALISFSPEPRMQRLYQMPPWGTLAAVAFCLFFSIAIILDFHPLPYGNAALCFAVGLDVLVGLATMCLIVFCTRCAHAASLESDRRLPMVLRLLESSWAMRLGAFSYSLYLVHIPIVLKLNQWSSGHFSPVPAFAFDLAGIPVVLVAAYLFHLAFERRFMSEHRARRKVGAVAP